MNLAMNLLTYFLEQTARWNLLFSQERSCQRAIALAFGILCGVGRRTFTRAISFHGNTQKDWSADYKVFSRWPWEARALFHPILEQAIQEQGLEHIVFSTDDTRVWRNGKHVPQTQWHRDPLGPPFQTNLRWGHRFLQASLVLPLYLQDGESSSRSIPVRFEMAPVVKKPGKQASQADWAEYRRQKKEKNLSVQFVVLTQELRQHLNQTGHPAKNACSKWRTAPSATAPFCGRIWEAQNVSVVTPLPQRHSPVQAGAGKGPPVLWRDQVHPGRGSATRFPSPVAEGQDLSRRMLSAGAFQGIEPNLLARGGPETAGSSAGGGPGGLSHQQKRAQILPAARLSADHRPENRRAGAAASLL